MTALQLAETQEIELRFTHHPPTGDQPDRFVLLRHQARLFAEAIVDKTPVCREQELALSRLEEAVMWANAAIARRE